MVGRGGIIIKKERNRIGFVGRGHLEEPSCVSLYFSSVGRNKLLTDGWKVFLSVRKLLLSLSRKKEDWANKKVKKTKQKEKKKAKRELCGRWWLVGLIYIRWRPAACHKSFVCTLIAESSLWQSRAGKSNSNPAGHGAFEMAAGWLADERDT